MLELIFVLGLLGAVVVLPIVGVFLLLRFIFDVVMVPIQILGAILGVIVAGVILLVAGVLVGPLLGVFSVGLCLAALPTIAITLLLVAAPVALVALIAYGLYRLLRPHKEESAT